MHCVDGRMPEGSEYGPLASEREQLGPEGPDSGERSPGSHALVRSEVRRFWSRLPRIFQPLELFHVREVLVAPSRLLVGDERGLADVRDWVAVEVEGLRAL